jgi:hypothetical protein
MYVLGTSLAMAILLILYFERGNLLFAQKLKSWVCIAGHLGDCSKGAETLSGVNFNGAPFY